MNTYLKIIAILGMVLMLPLSLRASIIPPPPLRSYDLYVNNNTSGNIPYSVSLGDGLTLDGPGSNPLMSYSNQNDYHIWGTGYMLPSSTISIGVNDGKHLPCIVVIGLGSAQLVQSGTQGYTCQLTGNTLSLNP